MFVDSATEQTIAVTDLMLALQAFGAIVMLRTFPIRLPMWTDVWTAFFGLLAVSSTLGALAHGMHIGESAQSVIWAIVYLVLGLSMALFAIAAVTMTWNHEVARRTMPYFTAIALGFFAITQLWNDSFLLFVAYEAIAMLGALVLYSACFWSRREPNCAFIAAGILVGIVAAIVDVDSSLQMTLIWTFNNHGLFHLVQMLALSLIMVGIFQSHQAGAMVILAVDEKRFN